MGIPHLQPQTPSKKGALTGEISQVKSITKHAIMLAREYFLANIQLQSWGPEVGPAWQLHAGRHQLQGDLSQVAGEQHHHPQQHPRLQQVEEEREKN